MSNRARKGYNYYTRLIRNHRSVINHSREREEGGGKARVMRGGRREERERETEREKEEERNE